MGERPEQVVQQVGVHSASAGGLALLAEQAGAALLGQRRLCMSEPLPADRAAGRLAGLHSAVLLGYRRLIAQCLFLSCLQIQQLVGLLA